MGNSQMKSIIRSMLAALLLGAGAVGAQEATERFIPIGKSPGLSGIGTTVGEIREVNTAQRRVTVGNETRSATVVVGEDTRIWLDRSASGQSSLAGGFPDLAVGRRAEVRPAPDGPGAIWIKVRPE